MESRGVYMSTEPAVVKKYGDGLLKFNARILEVVKNWEALVQADDAQQFATFKKRINSSSNSATSWFAAASRSTRRLGANGATTTPTAKCATALNKDLEALSQGLRRTQQETRRNRPTPTT